MKSVVISGSGLFTPEQVITNEELVASYNQYVDQFNAQQSVAIANGDVAALEHSSCEFIEKASGIKARHVLYKDGILDPAIMQPVLPRRGEEQLPEMVEMAVVAAREAMAQANKTAADIDLIVIATPNDTHADLARRALAAGAVGHHRAESVLAGRRDAVAVRVGVRRVAGAAGGVSDVMAKQDLGFMYSRSLADPDGHVWEAFWLDPAAITG